MNGLYAGKSPQSGYGADQDSHVELNEHQVDIAQAEYEFNELSRQLSRRSAAARSNSKLSCTTAAAVDIEKAEVKEEETERFDLREYLTSSNDANQKAGIKHKVKINTAFKACNIFTSHRFAERWCYLGRSRS